MTTLTLNEAEYIATRVGEISAGKPFSKLSITAVLPKSAALNYTETMFLVYESPCGAGDNPSVNVTIVY